MKTYLKENSNKVYGVINRMVDNYPISEDIRKEWKVKILIPYIQFLTELEILKKYSWIDNSSHLKQHCDFIEKIIVISEGSDKNELPSDKFNKHLNELISNWINLDLDTELKEQERIFYSRIAWQDEPLEKDEKKETPLQKKKAEAGIMLNKKRHVNF